MASLFECEVRFIIEEIDAFKKRLRELEAELVFDYEFTDYYFEPKQDKWNPVEKNIRIRKWKTPQKPTTVYFVKNKIIKIDKIKFKRALYLQGKVPLFEGDLETCKSLLIDLGFKSWFTLKKEKSSIWKLPKYNFYTINEYIPGLGWWGELEFEGKDPNKAKKQIERALKLLEIPLHLVTHKPISAIFIENNK